MSCPPSLISTDGLDVVEEAVEVDSEVGNWMLCWLTLADDDEEEEGAFADEDVVIELLPLPAAFPPYEYHAHPFPATSLSLLATISYYNEALM